MARRLSFSRLIPVHQPLVFIAAAFVSGLLYSSFNRYETWVWMLLTSVLWVVLTATLSLRLSSAISLALLLSSFFSIGGALWSVHEAGTGSGRIRVLFERGDLETGEPVELQGRLFLAPELAPDRIYLHLDVESAGTLGRHFKATGSVMIMVPFNDPESRREYDTLSLDYGARLRIVCNLKNGRGYRNPGAPDFQEILETQGYDAQGWVKSPLLIEVLGDGDRSFVLSKLFDLRARMIAVTLEHFTQPAKGILAAALFGNRYFLSRGTAEAFRVEGTYHLLVISGMHVAMIAAVVLWLAKFISDSRIIRCALAFLVIWAYALMIGNQPSITRSVIMMTIFLGGRLIFRTSAGANILAASALIQLAWQPSDLFNSGFQLSFLTVLIIVLLVVPIHSRLRTAGAWKPAAHAPFPPRIPAPVKFIAESMFWNERAFRKEMRDSRIRYRLIKAGSGITLNRLRLQGAIVWIAMTVMTSIAVQAALLPLMVERFHRFSIISPVANVIEGLLITALMLAGAIFLLLYLLFGERISFFCAPVDWIGNLIRRENEYLTSLGPAAIRTPDPGEWAVAAYFAYFLSVVALLIVINEWNPFRKGDEKGVWEARRLRLAGIAIGATASATILLVGLLVVLHPLPHRFERGRLSLTFLDVGQGDSILVTFPQGKLMMIDSGGRPDFGRYKDGDGDSAPAFVEDRIGVAEAAVMPFLWSRGIRRLDWIAATHGDADHIQAFEDITRNFEITQALKPASLQTPARNSVFERTGSGLNVRSVGKGDGFDADGARVDIIWPSASNPEELGTDNNLSLVVMITYGSRKFLLSGDMEQEAEAELIRTGIDLRADVLKVAHHGSRTSTTDQFLSAVKPAEAVISVASPSPYGHPHQEVLARLTACGARIRQTSNCGAITISTDGRDLRVDTFVPCRSISR